MWCCFDDCGCLFSDSLSQTCLGERVKVSGALAIRAITWRAGVEAASNALAPLTLLTLTPILNLTIFRPSRAALGRSVARASMARKRAPSLPAGAGEKE